MGSFSGYGFKRAIKAALVGEAAFGCNVNHSAVIFVHQLNGMVNAEISKQLVKVHAGQFFDAVREIIRAVAQRGGHIGKGNLFGAM